MAADPTSNETDNAPEESIDSSPPHLGQAPSPPRPPRPAKRAGGVGRMPMPAGARPRESHDDRSDSDFDRAPSLPLDADDEPPNSPFPLTAARVTPSSRSGPPLSYRSSEGAPPAAFSDAPRRRSEPPAHAAFADRDPPVPGWDAPRGSHSDAAPSIPNSDAPREAFSDAAPPVPSSDAPPPSWGSVAPPASVATGHRELGRRAPEPQRTPVAPQRTPAVPAASWQVMSPRVSAQAAEASSPPVGLDLDDGDEQSEATMVGEVPRNLLELSSSGGDENTRAYTAPQELIELAKRKREERLQAKAAAATTPPMASTAVTQRPPARRRADVGDSDYESAGSQRRAPPSSDATPPRGMLAAVTPPHGTPVVSPSDSPFDSDGAAPAVARSLAPEREPLAPGSGPEIEISPIPPPTSSLLALGRATSGPLEAESAPAVNDVSPSSELANASQLIKPSQRDKSWFAGSRRWLLIAALCMLVGFVLSRWRGIEQLLFR